MSYRRRNTAITRLMRIYRWRMHNDRDQWGNGDAAATTSCTRRSKILSIASWPGAGPSRLAAIVLAIG